MNRKKINKIKYFCGVSALIVLQGLMSVLISGCAAFQHGFEESDYAGLWLKVVENDPAKKSGYKRLKNEMDYDGALNTFVTGKGLPDYIHVISGEGLELAYLKERKFYHFQRPWYTPLAKLTSVHGFDEQELPESMIRGLEEIAVAKTDLGERGRGPKEIKRIPLQGTDYEEYGKKHAIVIGISDYKELELESNERDKTRLLDLRYADDDARDFIKFLKTKEKSGGDWLIHSFIDQEAKKEDILKKLDDVLTRSRRTDLVYIFFSGHGRATPYDASEIYLLTYDFKYEDYYDGVPYSWLRNKIEESSAEHIISFIDACKSGTIGFARGGDNRPDTRFMGELTVTIPNKVIFTSGRGSQQAFECEKLENGVFTYFIVEGLKGKAEDLDNDRFVDLSELRDYVEEQVKSYTSSKKNMEMQIPMLWERKGLMADNFPLAIRD